MKLTKKKQELRVITIDELREFDSLKNLTNEEAIDVIDIIKQIAFITHNIITTNE